MADGPTIDRGYSEVDGLRMYYEIYEPVRQTSSRGGPLVLIHGGGSTIQTTFEKSHPFVCEKQKSSRNGITGSRADQRPGCGPFI